MERCECNLLLGTNGRPAPTAVFARQLSLHGVRLIAHEQSSRSTASLRAHRRTPSTSTQPAAVPLPAARSEPPLDLVLECGQRRRFHNRLRLRETCGSKMQRLPRSMATSGPTFCALTCTSCRKEDSLKLHRSSECLQTVFQSHLLALPNIMRVPPFVAGF